MSAAHSMNSSSRVVYKEPPAYPGYRIGSDGSVWTKWCKKPAGHRKGTIAYIGDEWRRLNPAKRRHGYLRVCLRKDGKQRSFYVHRLVLEAFVGPRPENMVCCHWDGNPKNNDISNLRWDTQAANQADMDRHGTRALGTRHAYAKANPAIVKRIRILRSMGKCTKDIARHFGISRESANDIIFGRTWKHVK